MLLAKYECVKCGRKYESNPGQQPKCIKCGGLYFNWLNYLEVFGGRHAR